MRAREGLLAEVEADDQAGVLDDLDEDRGLAAGGGAAPDLLDEALGDRVADELADAGAGELRDPGDLRAADGPKVVDRAQHEALVERAGLLVGRLGRKPHPRVAPHYFAKSPDKAEDRGPSRFVKSPDKVATATMGARAPRTHRHPTGLPVT